MGKSKNSKKSISKDTFKKLFMLYTVGKFQQGVFGKKRLHKIVYIIERESEIKPFEFKKYFYGQYSDSMDVFQDQLLSMGYLVASPLDPISPGQTGNIFELADKQLHQYYSIFMENIDPKLKNQIDNVIKEFGYLSEPELVEIAYRFPEFIHTEWDRIIFSESTPSRISVAKLDDDDIEELEISLNPKFINLLNRMDNAFDQTDFDPQKVSKVVDFF